MMGVQSAMGKEENKSQNSLEEVKKEKDIRENARGKTWNITKRREEMRAIDIRLMMAALGGAMIYFGLTQDFGFMQGNVKLVFKLIIIGIGAFLIYRGRYY